MILLQGLFSSMSQSFIGEIIEEQNNTSFFYKTLLELDGANMVSILSFDSRCLEALLHEKNKRFWKKQYPLFYKLNDNREG